MSPLRVLGEAVLAVVVQPVAIRAVAVEVAGWLQRLALVALLCVLSRQEKGLFTRVL